MSRDLHHAFGHPELRADATGPEGLYDRISLRDHIRTVEIGAFQQERGTTQRICFNLVVEVAPQTGPAEDDVDRILSYDTLTEAISHELAAERLNLLETLAARIAQRVLAAPQALRCFVRIEKLDRGPGALGVEIVRAKGDLADLGEPDTLRPRPVVVYLGNAALESGRIEDWLDELTHDGRPAILCVGPPAAVAPRASVAAAQRRIDLLAIEQNAWVLAGQDTRCVVVGSRTELDWAMKHGVITVWAPSKIVLDSVRSAESDGNPSRGAADGVQLAHWFALHMDAETFVAVGVTGPESDRLPSRNRPADAERLLEG